MATYYSPKYVLSSGNIEEIPVTPEDIHVGRVYRNWIGYNIGKDVFPTMEEAKADAKKRIQKKIASLEKQIQKLKAFL